MSSQDVYIIGFSCRFPESNSPHEFFQNLLHKQDMVTSDERRWKLGKENVPERSGKIKQSLECFDNKFFNVSGKQAEKMDPQLRLLLEVSYEALVDGGISLQDIKGTKTSVYIGGCHSDVYKGMLQNPDTITGYEQTGCADSMLANRLSYFYDLHGPSEQIDTACSSSLVALHHAVRDLETGVADFAIVGGSSLVLWSNVSTAFYKLKMLSPDGACKSFDKSANGYVRSEGSAILILSSRRNNKYKPYAKILGSGTNNGGWNPTGISFPSSQAQKELYFEVCHKAGISPKEVDYIEAHGTGTVAGDGQELEAIYDVFGKENKKLIIGSVKSNMGHAEGCSGLAGVIKVLLSFDQETLLPNLHLKEPNEKLRDMKVLTDPIPLWQGTRAGISSFGFGGTNAHVILEKCSFPEEKEEAHFPIKLTLLSSRTKEGVIDLKKHLNSEDVYSFPNREVKQKNPFREVLELPNEPDLLDLSDTENKVYFACSGNGSQWKGMGVQLYDTFPVFKTYIDRAGQAVGCDLSVLFRKGATTALEAVLSLTAFQIALIELLKTFGIRSEQIGGYLGHSAGEIVCSYLDQLTSLEQTMEIAYARGSNADLTGDTGLMAAVGLSYEEAQKFISEMGVKEQVVVACINSPRNVTLSGQKDVVFQLVEEIQRRNIFNRVLDTFGKGYHSPLFLPYKEPLKEALQKAFRNVPVTSRTEKWHSTVLNSTTQEFTSEYHVEAVLQPVDFAKALEKIPQKAVIVEIGPHSILKNIIKDTRPDLRYVSLAKKETDELQSFREGLGQLWKLGIEISIPQEKWERPPLPIREKWVSWDHTTRFPLPTELDYAGSNQTEYKVAFNLNSDEDKYLLGHCIDEKILLPATSYLCTLWGAFRKKHGLSISESVTYEFSEFEILQAVQVEPDSVVELIVTSVGNRYELSYKNEVIAKAKIEIDSGKSWEPISIDREPQWSEKKEFYRLVSRVGFNYKDAFAVVEKFDCDFERNRNTSYLEWTGNWITFLDGLLQVSLMAPRKHLENLCVPVRIGPVFINPKIFLDSHSKVVISDFNTSRISANGIEIYRVETKVLNRNRSTQQKHQVEFKRACDVVPFGKNFDLDPYYNGYASCFVNSSIERSRKLIQQQGKSEIGHYKRILEIYDRWSHYTPVSQEEKDKYLQHPDCLHLQILEDLYSKTPEDFFERPLVSIGQHPKHEELYFKDLIASHHVKNWFLQFFSIAQDNSPHADLNILEIGAGTGGLTRVVAPYIVNDRYIATDISTTSQIVETPEIANLDFTYEKFDLNNSEDYKLLKKHNIDLVLASNSLHTGQNLDRSLKSIYENLKEGAFLIFCEATSPAGLGLFGMDPKTWEFDDTRDYGLWISVDHWVEKLKGLGFETISLVTDTQNISTLFLVRKPLQVQFHIEKAPSIDHFEKWYPALRNCPKPTLLIAESLEQSGVDGFIRTVNKEESINDYFCAIADRAITPEELLLIKKFGLKVNVIQNGKLGTTCVKEIEYRPKKSKPEGYHLQFGITGDFSSAQWVQTRPPLGKEIRCKVKYAALNFRDIMIASGKIRQEVFNGPVPIGFEFSGVTSDGKRYMGFCKDAIGDEINLTPHICMPTPDSLSDEEAATIPVAYATVLYGLYERAHIQPHHTVLIHAGTGAVGQAALRICLHLGCKVFTTCHQGKKKILKEIFPQLVDEYILDSRTTEFEKQILHYTEGKGVDIILNSLAGDKLQASLRCLAQHGHFLEIGKYDLMNHTALDMNLLRKNTTVHGVDLDQIMWGKEGAQVLSHIEKGIKEGFVKPLVRTVFGSDQVVEAFRYMAAAKHIGKVLIDMQKPVSSLIPQFYHDPKDQSYYLITGGLGGFGLALVNWLFDRGVRHFLITSRRGVTTGEQKRMLSILRAQGATILISTLDVSKEKEAKELIEGIPSGIGAVFHLGMQLEDVFFKNMSKENWEKTVDIKAKGVINLDKLTQKTGVKYFVAFSSMVGHFGNPGQSNYGFGNKILEVVCRNRAAKGYHALAIEWGTIGDVGFVAKNKENLKNFTDGVPPVSIEDSLQFLNDALSQETNSLCIQNYAFSKRVSSTKTEKLSTESVIQSIGDIVKIDLRKCSASETLEVLGADSLQTVEIQAVLIRSIQEVLPLKKISTMKVSELIALIDSKLQQTSPSNAKSDIQQIQQKNPIIAEVHREKSDQVIYVFLGFGVHPEKVQFPRFSHYNISIVHWQESENLQDLIHNLQSDIASKNYQNVVFLTHSAGYQIAQSVLNEGTIRAHKIVSVSLVNEKLIPFFDNVDQLRTLSDIDTQRMYKASAFFVENHLPLQKIRQQAVLLSLLRTARSILPDTILVPTQDPICDRSLRGIEIPGNHQAESLNMEELYTYI